MEVRRGGGAEERVTDQGGRRCCRSGCGHRHEHHDQRGAERSWCGRTWRLKDDEEVREGKEGGRERPDQ